MEKFEQYKFEIECYEKEGYIRINYWGNHGISEAQKLGEEIVKFSKKCKKKFSVLNDLRKGETATKEAMDVYSQLLKNPQIKTHIFLVPESGPVVIIPDLLIKMSGITNATLFHNEEKALDYLLKQ